MSTSSARRQQRHQRADRITLPPFAGVDGEGGDIDDRHEYLMLRAGSELLETGKPLGPYECFDFLAGLRTDQIYVAFAFDYDVTMMIRSLPPGRVDKLFDRKSREIVRNGEFTGRYNPVDVGQEWQIDYMPHKEFRVRRKNAKRWVVINDTFTFFQASFVTTLRKWFKDDPDPAIDAAIDKIAEGKGMRNEFTRLGKYERDYNELECIMLERLMEKFRELCFSLDIRPQKWQGPGNLVSAIFTREGIPRKQQEHVPRQVWLDANSAYYGGRFEASAYGLIE